jgi:hypothetical protein
MEHDVGVDVSLKQTSICVMDQTGAVVRESVVDSDPEANSIYVRSKALGAVRIGLETGPTGSARPRSRSPQARGHLHRMWIEGTEFNWSTIAA